MTLEEKRAKQREYSRKYREKKPYKVAAYSQSDGHRRSAIEYYHRNREDILAKRKAKRGNETAKVIVTLIEQKQQTQQMSQKIDQWLEDYNKLFDR